MAGDTSFGNAIIDDYMLKNCKLDFDLNGDMSRNGKKIDSLYNHIKNDLFFNEKLPKSLDRNYFHHYLNNLSKTFEARDIIFTLLSIIPETIKKIIPSHKNYHIVLSGG